MKIAIATDHAGFALKSTIIEYFESKKIAYLDLGPNNLLSRVDYPDFAIKVARMVADGEADFGILICGTGIGMCITANKVKGIRAANVTDTYSAKVSRAHNNANILCLGARVTGVGLAIDIVDTWLSAIFEGGRHKQRIDKIAEFEGGKR
jgi:ribose 5-phosphate isomerase B